MINFPLVENTMAHYGYNAEEEFCLKGDVE